MSDICMCHWKDCPMKGKCYRHTAPKSEYQTFFIEEPIKDWKCDYFWEDENTKQEKKEE